MPPAHAPRTPDPDAEEEPQASKLERKGAGEVSSSQEIIPDPGLEELAEALRPTVLRLARRLYREAQRVGASALDAQLLMVLKLRPGIGVNELAAKEGMSAPTMSAHIKRLEASGWVARGGERGGEDRRRAPLSLTASGAEALEAIRRSRNDWLRARLKTLSPADRAALAAAAPALRRLEGHEG